MANMKMAANKQTSMNTPQHNQSGTVPQRTPPTSTNWLPMAVETNHPPIIMPLYLGGATFDTNDMPIGESNNSPKVRMR